MSARLEYFLRNTVRTFRVTFADLTSTAGSTGSRLNFEVTGVANKRVKLRHLQIFKPSTAIAPFQLGQYVVASTGSTGQSIISPVRLNDPNGSTFGGTVRFYSSAPAAGTLLNQGFLVDQDLTTGDVVNEHFGDEKGISVPTLEGSSESFAGLVTSTLSVIFNGYLEFTEEP